MSDLKSPVLWAHESMALLLENSLFLPHIHHDTDDEPATVSDLVYVTRPGSFTTGASTTKPTLPAVLSHLIQGGFFISDDELAGKSFKELVAEHLKPKIRFLAEVIDTTISACIPQFSSQLIGKHGHFSQETLHEARQTMDDACVFTEGRNLVVSSEVEAAIINKNMDRCGFNVLMNTSQPSLPNKTGAVNFGFHRDALALVSRPVKNLSNDGSDQSERVVYDNITLEVTTWRMDAVQQTEFTVYFLYGIVVMDPTFGLLMLS